MKTKLLLYLLLFIATTCFDNIINVRWLSAMNNYTIFASAILFPLSGILFFSIPTLYLKTKGKISYENTFKLVSHKDLIIIAFFDSTNSVLQSIATPYLPIVAMSIYNRLILIGIPIASFFYLGKRYLPNHYLGIFLTLYGILIAFMPNFLNHESLGNGWAGLYILGIVPAIFSFLYKEKKLRGNPEIWWFNAWVCIYQLIIGILLLPFNILITKNTSFSDFGKQITDGFVCQFTGKNMQENDNCQYALIWFLLFNILVTFINVLMFIIIRDGSSVLFVITNTVKTPITSFLGSFKVLAGKNTSKLTLADLFAFIMLIVGSLVYNWKEEIQTSQNQISEDYINLEDENNEDSKSLSLEAQIINQINDS